MIKQMVDLLNNAKIENYKSQNERFQELKVIALKLREFGITVQTYPELKHYIQDANRFVQEGFSIKGKVPLRGLQRNLVYNLISSKHIDSNIVLEFSKHT